MSQDFVTITLKVPKEVIQFFRDLHTCRRLEDALVAELVDVCHAQIEAMTPKMLIDKYALDPVFKQYGMTK